MNYRTAILRTNLCDNNPDCPMISICPQRAVIYDHNTLRISVNEEQCIACAKCYDEHCRLFEIAKSENDYKRIKRKIAEDPLQQADLQIDRFGADIVDNDYAIDESIWEAGIDSFISSISGLSFTEIVIQRESECLHDCIPIAECIDINIYRKVLVYNEIIAERIRERYAFFSFPVILIFYKGTLIDKIWGVFKKSSNGDILVSKLREIINQYGGR